MKVIEILVDKDPTEFAAALCTLIEKKLGLQLHAERDHGDTVQGHINTSSEGKISVVLYEDADVPKLQFTLNARNIGHYVDSHKQSVNKSVEGIKVEIAEVLAQSGFTPVI